MVEIVFFVQLIVIIEMNVIDRLKKVRTFTSFDTSCTMEENTENGFKINVVSPKNPKVCSQQYRSTSIIEASIEEELRGSILSKSHQKMAILNSQLRQSNKSWQNGFNNDHVSGTQINKRETVEQVEKESQSHSQSVIDIESSCLFSSSQSSCSSKNSRGYIGNIMTAQQELRFSPIPLNISDKCRDKKKIQGTANFGRSEPLELRIKQSQIQRKLEKECVRFGLDNDQIISIHDTDNSRKNIDDSQRLRPTASKLRMKEKVNDKNDTTKLSEARSSSRMKLRDYLFMAHSSRTKNNSEKHQLLLSRKTSPGPSELPKIGTVNSPIRHSSKNLLDNLSDFDSKPSELHRSASRYNISNFQMCQVLKSQISNEIGSIKSSLSSIENELNDVEICSREFSTEEMLLLYNMRREIKDHIARNVNNMLESIKQKKRNIHMPVKKMEEDQVIQSMTCSTFLKRHS